ncbi:MAG: hypothetical protein WAO41_02520 [Candidatus Nanopelagicales bacterium]
MNAQTRRWLYLATGVAAAVIPILVQLGVLDSGQGESTNTLILTIASLFGATGAATAARHVHTQIKDGVHDPALPAVDQLRESANQVISQAQEAQVNLDVLKDITGSLVGQVPVVGDLVQQAMNQLLPK